MDKIPSTLALLSADGHEYLNREVADIKAAYPGCKRMARAVVIRGIVDGIRQAGFSFANCSDEFQIAGKLKAALTTNTGVQ